MPITNIYGLKKKKRLEVEEEIKKAAIDMGISIDTLKRIATIEYIKKGAAQQ